MDWILDLYQSVDDIRAYGQTIVYAVHESIGHLGIFVSGSVAKKEHDEFASNIDLIDVLPPGLYEAVMVPRDPGDASADLIGGNYLLRFEARSLDDIRALGANTEEDDRKFASVARVSEINLGLYRTFLQPWVHNWANESLAALARQYHPLRLQYELFSHANAFTRSLLHYVDEVHQNRQPVPTDNVFWQAQQQLAQWIEASLDAYRDTRDQLAETLFHAVFGSPLVQALVGLRACDAGARRKPGNDAAHLALVAKRICELKDGVADGGAREATLRALLYVRMPDGAIDERGFNFLRRAREDAGKDLTLSMFKRLVREQYFMLLLDERRAIAAIPDMLKRDPDRAARMLGNMRRLIDAVGLRTSEAKARMAEIEELVESGIKAGDGQVADRKMRRVRSMRLARTHAGTDPKQHH